MFKPRGLSMSHTFHRSTIFKSGDLNLPLLPARPVRMDVQTDSPFHVAPIHGIWVVCKSVAGFFFQEGRSDSSSRAALALKQARCNRR